MAKGNIKSDLVLNLVTDNFSKQLQGVKKSLSQDYKDLNRLTGESGKKLADTFSDASKQSKNAISGIIDNVQDLGHHLDKNFKIPDDFAADLTSAGGLLQQFKDEVSATQKAFGELDENASNIEELSKLRDSGLFSGEQQEQIERAVGELESLQKASKENLGINFTPKELEALGKYKDIADSLGGLNMDEGLYNTLKKASDEEIAISQERSKRAKLEKDKDSLQRAPGEWNDDKQKALDAINQQIAASNEKLAESDAEQANAMANIQENNEKMAKLAAFAQNPIGTMKSFLNPATFLKMGQEKMNKDFASRMKDYTKELNKLEGKKDPESAEKRKQIKSDMKKDALKTAAANVGLNALGKVASGLIGIFKKVGSALWQGFKNLLAGVKDIVKGFTDLNTGMATFSTSTSLISNASAREQQMKYGLSSSDNWALTQTMGMLGMQGDEDLMYMNSDQREVFLSYMDRFSSFYDEMEQSGALEDIQKLQLDFKMFQQEFAMKIMNWFAQNKDAILGIFKTILTILGNLLNAVITIYNALNFLWGGKDLEKLDMSIFESLGESLSSSYNSSSGAATSGYGTPVSKTTNNSTNNVNITISGVEQESMIKQVQNMVNEYTDMNAKNTAMKYGV